MNEVALLKQQTDEIVGIDMKFRPARSFAASYRWNSRNLEAHDSIGMADPARCGKISCSLFQTSLLPLSTLSGTLMRLRTMNRVWMMKTREQAVGVKNGTLMKWRSGIQGKPTRRE